MVPTETIAEWHGFYGAVAGVGATLVGLVFVAISIHVARSPADARTRRLAVMSAVNLSHPMLAALIMLMPVASGTQGAVLMLLALNTLGATLTISTGEARKPDGQNRQMVLYRYFVPLAASVLLLVGAIGIALGHSWGLAAVPMFVLVMFAIGLDNAWDLLLGDFRKRSIIDL